MFCYSQIDLSSDVDFSGPVYTTSYLSFRGVGNRNANEWKAHPERLKRVLKAVSQCSLKDSLKTLDVFACDVEAKQVEEMLREFELNDVKVVEENAWSLDD